eukprot:c24814_g1_i1 orf=831-1541(+)
MEGKGRMLFDLNELPEDDSDIVLPCKAEPQDAQPAKQHALQTLVSSKEPEPELARTLYNLGNSETSMGRPHTTQLMDTAPVHLGQHPLSCFRPFVRPLLKGDEPFQVATQIDDYKAPKTVKVENALFKHAPELNNGNHLESEDAHKNWEHLKTISETVKGHTNEDLGCSLHGNPVQDALKREEQPSNARAAKEVKDNVLFESASVDASLKTDAPKSSQPVLDNKLSSNFGKRGRSD